MHGNNFAVIRNSELLRNTYALPFPIFETISKYWQVPSRINSKWFFKCVPAKKFYL
jgi:hypothetical protein